MPTKPTDEKTPAAPRADLWDAGAGLAAAAVLVGLGVWHWPAALVAGGAAYLWLYVHREKSLAAQSPPRR